MRKGLLAILPDGAAASVSVSVEELPSGIPAVFLTGDLKDDARMMRIKGELTPIVMRRDPKLPAIPGWTEQLGAVERAEILCRMNRIYAPAVGPGID